MRMWLVDPATMCRKHLLGEHVEMHMYLGSMLRRGQMTGYLEGNLLEPAVLFSRHEELAAEMASRGYKHASPMDEVAATQAPTAYLSNFEMATVIDKTAAMTELHNRCPECAKLWKEKNHAAD